MKPPCLVLPAHLTDRGWRRWGADRFEQHAVRLDGSPPYPFSATCHGEAGRWWSAYSEWTCRALRDGSPSLVETIERLEQAERVFSSLWRGGGIVPSRPGWSHRVRNSRDEWHAVTDTSNLVLSVLHLRPTRPAGSFSAGTEGMRFAALIDGKLLTHVNRGGAGEVSINWDALTVFDDVQHAMAAAERLARESDIAAIDPVRLLEHSLLRVYLINERG